MVGPSLFYPSKNHVFVGKLRFNLTSNTTYGYNTNINKSQEPDPTST